MTPFRFEQGVPVDFSTGCERQCIHENEVRGNHVIREFFLKMYAKVRTGNPGFGMWNDVCGKQFFAGRILGGDNHVLVHIRMFRQNGLDFTRFNSESTDFDLMVRASREFDNSVRSVAAEISGFIESGSGFFGKRIGNKPRCGQIRPAEIAMGKPDPTDMQFSRNTDRNRPQVLIQDMHACVRDRFTDRRKSRPVVRRTFQCERRDDMGFGRSIVVMQRAVFHCF